MNTYDLIGKTAELLKKKHTNTGGPTNNPNPTTVVVRPTICTVQSFDGSPARYRQFEQLFEDIIEHDPSYSDAEKFVAFRNLVGDHGDQFISSLRPNHDGLQKAKQRLKRYFDDLVLVREDATKKINQLEPVDWGSTSSFKLRATCNVLEEAVQSLKDCNTDPNYLGDTVFTLIGSKIPRHDHDSERRVTVAMKSTTSDFGVAVQCSVVARLNPMTLEAVSPSVKAKLASQGYEFADIDSTEQKQYPVELIIGIPECFDLVWSTPKKWQDGLYLIETGFGWTVSGLSGLDESLRRKFKPTDQGLDSTTTTNDQLQQKQSLTITCNAGPIEEKKACVAENQQEKLQCDDKHADELSLTSRLDIADQSLKNREPLDLTETAIRELTYSCAKIARQTDPNSTKKAQCLPDHAVYRDSDAVFDPGGSLTITTEPDLQGRPSKRRGHHEVK
ncbi:hypothetical protein TYRP_020533 [Tyrophagus putrescentiae]|nr:hypothetical protein TYRP_020533 [Tyrophagus putrescentiae]